MSDYPTLSPDDDLDFSEAMQGITRHHHDRADLSKPAPVDISIEYKRSQAIREEEKVIDDLSSEAVGLVESNEELLFVSPGVQLRLIKRLKQGHVPWEAGLDLHGYSIDKARDQVSHFLRDARRQNMRSVILVHGKAHTQAGKSPLIKSYVNEWLRRFPGVLAFCSAQPKDGGTGAVYVLLKRDS